MSAVDYSVLAARVLRRKFTTIRGSGLSRDRGIAIVAQAMREATRARRRMRWWVGGALTTAAAAVVLLTTSHYLHVFHGTNPPRFASACGESAVGCAADGPATGVDVGHMNGRQFVPGNIIQAESGRPATVEFDSGTRIALDGNTQLAYDEGRANHRPMK